MDGQFDLVVVGSALLTLRPRGPGFAWDDGPIASGSAAVQLAFRVPPHVVHACHEALRSQVWRF
jgi:glyoxylase I family protein